MNGPAPTADQSVELEACLARLKDINEQLDSASRRAYEALVPYMTIRPESAEHEAQLHQQWAAALELIEFAFAMQATLSPVSRQFDLLPPAPTWWSEETDPQEQRLRSAAPAS